MGPTVKVKALLVVSVFVIGFSIFLSPSPEPSSSSDSDTCVSGRHSSYEKAIEVLKSEGYNLTANFLMGFQQQSAHVVLFAPTDWAVARDSPEFDDRSPIFLRHALSGTLPPLPDGSGMKLYGTYSADSSSVVTMGRNSLQRQYTINNCVPFTWIRLLYEDDSFTIYGLPEILPPAFSRCSKIVYQDSFQWLKTIFADQI